MLHIIKKKIDSSLSCYHSPSVISERTEGCQDVSPAHRLSREQPNIGISNPNLRLAWFS